MNSFLSIVISSCRNLKTVYPFNENNETYMVYRVYPIWFTGGKIF